jgi:uncharacterized membrane protein
MRTIDAVHRVLDWLEPESAKVRFEAPPGARTWDLAVVSFLIPAALFTALVLLAPFTIPPGSTGDLSGRVGSVENAGVIATFPEPARWVYQLGDIACHTKASRSFVLNDNQMSFCARDVAIFVGIAAGLALCLRPGGPAYRWVVMLPWWSYLALLAPIAADGGAQDFLGMESDNLRRVITGSLAGLAVAFSLVFIVYEGHFAAARLRGVRTSRRAGLTSPAAHADERLSEPGSTASLGSKAVESAPTEKKNPLHP